MNILISLVVFSLGLAFGSFINMAVWRINKNESFLGRSYCDNTKEALSFLDLIPFFSYIVYKGKCRSCGKKLPLVYPIVELLTGFIFVLTLWKINSLGLTGIEFAFNLIIAEIFVIFFIFFAVYDYLYWEVDLLAVLLAIGMAVVSHIFSIFFPIAILPGIVEGIVGGVVGALMIWLLVVITKKSGMGEDDIFLFGLTVVLLLVMASWSAPTLLLTLAPR